MSYPNLPPRHQGSRGRGRMGGELHHQPKQPPIFQARANVPGSALIHQPPYQKLPVTAIPLPQQNNRVLLPNQQHQQQMYLPPGAPSGSILNRPPSLFQHHALAPQQLMPLQMWMPQQNQSTAQPINLGQPPMAMSQHSLINQPLLRGVMMHQGNNPPVIYSPEQMDVSMSRSKPSTSTKTRSRAIRIVDPNTNTEVKVGHTNDREVPVKTTQAEDSVNPTATDAAVAAEFKSKVQSVAEGTSVGVVEGGGTAVQFRPNAIITNPDQGKAQGTETEGRVDIGVKEDEVKGNSLSTGGSVLEPPAQTESKIGRITPPETRITLPEALLSKETKQISAETDPQSESGEKGNTEGVSGREEQMSEDIAGLKGVETSGDMLGVKVEETSGDVVLGDKGEGTSEVMLGDKGEVTSGGVLGVKGEENGHVSELKVEKRSGGVSGINEEDVEVRSEEDVSGMNGEGSYGGTLEVKREERSGGVSKEEEEKFEEVCESVSEKNPASTVPTEDSAAPDIPPVNIYSSDNVPGKQNVNNAVSSTPQVTECMPEVTPTAAREENQAIEELVVDKEENVEPERIEIEPPLFVGNQLDTEMSLSSHSEEVPAENVMKESSQRIAEEEKSVEQKVDIQHHPNPSQATPTRSSETTPTIMETDRRMEAWVASNSESNRNKNGSETSANLNSVSGGTNKNNIALRGGVSGHEGRRTMYQREFLMRFKDMAICKEKPRDLELGDLDYSPRDRESLMGLSYYRGVGGGGKRRGSEPKRIAYQPNVEKVELRKADVRWTRPQDRLHEMSSNQVETEEVYRKFQAILNKLTPQKFQSLAEQARNLEIHTEERLRGCIDKIFTKALEEPSFSIAYANLCKVMSPIKVEWVLEDGKVKTTNFRRMLLTKCQQEFEKDKKDDETFDTMREAINQAETEEKRQELEMELSIEMTRMRKRSLGNIRFIGELFKLKMLSETIMHECITRLLKSTSDEESLECFARLITTTGKDLDAKQEAKGYIDAYFKRITDIIKKGKIPARIKFMLQDVQELRENNWIPRVRQDQQLKTIDQIHAEAKLEEEKEKEMVQQHQVINSLRLREGGRDSRRGSKSGGSGDEWQTKGDRERREGRERIDQSKFLGLLKRNKEKSSSQGPLGPNTSLRPTGWKKGSLSTTSQTTDSSKTGKQSRSSTSSSKRTEGRGPAGRSSGSGSRRSHTTPESERESALHTVSLFTTNNQNQPPSRDAPAQAVLRQEKKPTLPVTENKLDEDAVRRKAISIIDELVTNADFKEAVECVREMSSSGLMHVLVTEGINHTLEKKSEFRSVTGKLFSKLVQEKVLIQQKFLDGLNGVLEFSEDMCIDIPNFWLYMGEVLAPVMAHSTLSLSLLGKIHSSLVDSGKAAILVAKVLQQCRKVLGTEEAVKALWSQSRLEWDSLGMKVEDLGEFLQNQELGYLHTEDCGEESVPAYLHRLQQLLSSDITNKEIISWIKENCSEAKSPIFVRNLTSAIVYAAVTGSGNSAIFNSELFEKRTEIVKVYSNDKHGLEALYGLQITVAKLQHPPKLLHEMFNIVYNLDIAGEDEFVSWKDKGTVNFGRGNAVMNVKGFFEWLMSTSDGETEDGPTNFEDGT